MLVTTSWPSRQGDWTGHFVRQEALELRGRGVRVDVLAPTAFGVMSPFGPPGAPARIAAFPPRVIGALPWLWRSFSAVRHEPHDALIAHWVIPCGLVALASRAPEVELVSHGSDVRWLVAAPRRVRERYVGALLERATRWRFVSDALLAHLVRVLDGRVGALLEERAVVRAPSLHIPDLGGRPQALREKLGPFDVSVGRLVASKHVERAITHAVRARRLLVVVGDGPERRALERHAARSGGRVQFVGAQPRSEALAYIAAARSLLMASTAEGCSTVVREAAALSTPVENV